VPRRVSPRDRDGRSAVASSCRIDDVRGYYDRILPFYEKESIARAHLTFWRGLARTHEPGRILEIGSGLGRITAELGREAPAVGIDLSLEMLRRAVRGANGASRARFVAADMRRVNFSRPFDLIVAPSDPLSHLTSMADRRRALRAVARQLSPDGIFVLEGLYRGRRAFELTSRRIRHAAGVLRIDEGWFPAGVKDLWHARYRYTDRRPGSPDDTLSASFLARAWDPGSLRSLFHSCGLRVESLWGDFDRRPFGRAASRLVVLARRLSAPAGSSNPRRRARSSR
jgi:SAM-dependent methyltransferase